MVVDLVEVQQSLTSIIQELDLNGDIEEATELVLDRLLNEHPGVARGLLYSPVRQAVRRVLREEVREIEHSVGTDPIAGRADLLLKTFYAPGFGRVVWGEATVEQHLARIGMLRAKADGIVDTIDLHDQAIRDIQEAGVACLNEIP